MGVYSSNVNVDDAMNNAGKVKSSIPRAAEKDFSSPGFRNLLLSSRAMLSMHGYILTHINPD